MWELKPSLNFRPSLSKTIWRRTKKTFEFGYLWLLLFRLNAAPFACKTAESPDLDPAFLLQSVDEQAKDRFDNALSVFMCRISFVAGFSMRSERIAVVFLPSTCLFIVSPGPPCPLCRRSVFLNRLRRAEVRTQGKCLSAAVSWEWREDLPLPLPSPPKSGIMWTIYNSLEMHGYLLNI